MRQRSRFPGCPRSSGFAGRLAILVPLLLILLASALGEGAPTAYFNPRVPPPIPAKHDPSGDDYFTDAIFIGDSMMECVQMYNLFPSAKIVCRSGISSADANWRIFRINEWDEPRNIYEMIEYYESNKIYIFLGANSLDVKTSAEALRDYRVMIDDMVRRFPTCYIYIIPPPSVTKKAMDTMKLGPLRYRNFRDGLMEISQDYKLYFLDYYALIVNEEGYMIDIYDGGDGGHPSKRGLKVLENLVRTHTVEYPAAAEQSP